MFVLILTKNIKDVVAVSYSWTDNSHNVILKKLFRFPMHAVTCNILLWHHIHDETNIKTNHRIHLVMFISISKCKSIFIFVLRTVWNLFWSNVLYPWCKCKDKQNWDGWHMGRWTRPWLGQVRASNHNKGRWWLAIICKLRKNFSNFESELQTAFKRMNVK